MDILGAIKREERKLERQLDVHNPESSQLNLEGGPGLDIRLTDRQTARS